MLGTTPIGALLWSRSDIPQLIDRDTPANGNVAPYELEVIASLVKATKPHAVFEIGTFDGRTTLNMAANAPNGATIFTLDLPSSELGATVFSLELNEDIFVKKDHPGARIAKSDGKSNIIQLLGDSGSFDFRPYYGIIDFMFIDGSHSYNYVKSDTLAALKMVRPGGVIIWHDYVRDGFTPFPGVPQALKEFFLTDSRFEKLTQIAGTSIVYLKVPEGAPKPDFRPVLLGDSSRPEHLTGSLHVTPNVQALVNAPSIPLDIAIQNTGPAVWLPSDAALGPVRAGARVLDMAGNVVEASFWRADLPYRRATFPGEMIRFQTETPRPKSQLCILEFDLVAEGVTWFNLPSRPRIVLGAETYLDVLRAENERITIDLSKKIDLLTAQLDAMSRSTSWRITAPLRRVRRLIKSTTAR